MDDTLNFGQRMAQRRREAGTKNPGRKPIAEKFKRQIDGTLKVFGDNLPGLAEQYVDEVRVRDPKRCPEHDKVLRCPECDHLSQRKTFDHHAAQYVFDRIMGRPTTRSENTVTLSFVQQYTTAIVAVFGE